VDIAKGVALNQTIGTLMMMSRTANVSWDTVSEIFVSFQNNMALQDLIKAVLKRKMMTVSANFY
jgi:hypothetical protein